MIAFQFSLIDGGGGVWTLVTCQWCREGFAPPFSVMCHTFFFKLEVVFCKKVNSNQEMIPYGVSELMTLFCYCVRQQRPVLGSWWYIGLVQDLLLLLSLEVAQGRGWQQLPFQPCYSSQRSLPPFQMGPWATLPFGFAASRFREYIFYIALEKFLLCCRDMQCTASFELASGSKEAYFPAWNTSLNQLRRKNGVAG